MAIGIGRGRGCPFVKRLLLDEEGQSTTEFLLTAMSLAAASAALGALWHAARDGGLLGLASGAASHALGSGTLAGLKDILAF